jgi:membrane associated rhomboid family serine protease
MLYTIIIVIATALLSYRAFSDERLFNKLVLWPKKMDNPSEYYRLLTCGFIHADMMHLVFNMFTLYFFGQVIEQAYDTFGIGKALFILLYLSGIVVASLPSYLKHRNDSYYRSLGASGGVAAIVFSFVYFAPWEKIYLFGIEFLGVPGIILALAYLGYSVYMSRKGGTYVNHDAHFWGSVYGFVFTLAVDPDHGQRFFYQLTHPHF